MRIIGLSGSLRRHSFNTALLRAAAGLMPPGSELDVRSIEGIPLYNGDDEAGGLVDQKLRERLAQFLEGFVAFVR
jgi:chromate reductase, NAD(P)H dehydrogenase (quinone)